MSLPFDFIWLFTFFCLVWEGQQIKGVQHIELVAPMTVTDGPRAGEQSFDFDIGIDTPVPGWYTVLSKVTG